MYLIPSNHPAGRFFELFIVRNTFTTFKFYNRVSSSPKSVLIFSKKRLNFFLIFSQMRYPLHHKIMITLKTTNILSVHCVLKKNCNIIIESHTVCQFIKYCKHNLFLQVEEARLHF